MTFTAHPTRLQLRPFFFFIHCILYFVLHFCRLLFLLCLFVLCAVAGIRLVCLVGIQKPLLEHLYIPMMNPAECFHPEKNRQAACAFRIPTCVLCVSIRLWRGPPDVYMCMCVGFSVDSTFRVSGGDRTTYAISVDSSPKGVEDLLLPSFRMLRTLTTGCAHGLV